MKNNIEIEVKILLQDKKNAAEFLEALKKNGEVTVYEESSQLNHYFRFWKLEQLKTKVIQHLSEDDVKKLESVTELAKWFSVRTRKLNDRVILVVKATLNENEDSVNGTGRIEFEADVELSIDKLDAIILNSWFEYETKYSRDRVEYRYKNFNVTIDKNSGYWYLAELERVVEDEKDLEKITGEIRDEIKLLWFEELSQERVGRMYKHYINVWPHYYGTNNWFNVK